MRRVTNTIITCISDDQTFVQDVYEHLNGQLEKQTNLEESEDFFVTPELVSLDIDKNQIHVDARSRVLMGMIKRILGSYLRSNPSRFKDYDVIEFGDALNIGRISHPSQMEMLTCEICGFFTPYSEELHPHRMTHFGI